MFVQQFFKVSVNYKKTLSLECFLCPLQCQLLLFILFKKIFIYLAHWVLVVACRIFTLHCGMRDFQWHLGSNSLTRDRTQAPYIGSAEFQPLNHQGSPKFGFINYFFSLKDIIIATTYRALTVYKHLLIPYSYTLRLVLLFPFGKYRN